MSSRQVAESTVNMEKQPEVLSLDPQYLGDVLEDVRRVGRSTGAESVAEQVTARMQGRIDGVTQRAELADTHPRVLHLEWTDPLMCGGHWVPEMVELAGGTNCFGDKEMGSFPLEWDAVVESQPEVIVVMPCGFEVPRAMEDLPLLTEKRDGLPCRPCGTTASMLSTPATTPAGPVPGSLPVWRYSPR